SGVRAALEKSRGASLNRVRRVPPPRAASATAPARSPARRTRAPAPVPAAAPGPPRFDRPIGADRPRPQPWLPPVQSERTALPATRPTVPLGRARRASATGADRGL